MVHLTYLYLTVVRTSLLFCSGAPTTNKITSFLRENTDLPDLAT